eukprot:CAMPEP_0169443506 /NCGR_PEP_ID=MMETSP1042-20121227/9392_1 /TAXON_ID=464988 /ORGANISM="Hemiselmis andersenii, Strain CCMP1180" /LENGTH=219 /DNA_ID=CAMNT_0009554739 /DNA_START=531 /DNA_END=1188 /DNA_ORIENTATION=+
MSLRRQTPAPTLADGGVHTQTAMMIDSAIRNGGFVTSTGFGISPDGALGFADDIAPTPTTMADTQASFANIASAQRTEAPVHEVVDIFGSLPGKNGLVPQSADAPSARTPPQVLPPTHRSMLDLALGRTGTLRLHPGNRQLVEWANRTCTSVEIALCSDHPLPGIRPELVTSLALVDTIPCEDTILRLTNLRKLTVAFPLASLHVPDKRKLSSFCPPTV